MTKTRAPSDGSTRVSLASGALAIGAVVLLMTSDPSVVIGDLRVSWPVILVAFFVAELATSDIDIGENHHTVSLSEAVLVVGTLTLSAPMLVLCRVVAGSATMAMKRVPPHKAGFNVGLYAVEAALAVRLLQTWELPAGHDALWPLAAAGAVVASVLGGLAVVAIIAAVTDSPAWPAVRRSVLGLTLTSATSASLGAIAALILVVNPVLLALLASTVALAQLAVRTNTNTIAKIAELDAGRRLSEALGGEVTTASVLETSLREITILVKAERAEVFVTRGDALARGCHRLGADGRMEVVHSGLPNLTAHSLRTAMPLGDGTAELSVVRSPTAPPFDEGDRRLLVGLAAQMSIALSKAILLDRVAHDAHHDALTGLHNRQWFGQRLEELAAGGATGALVLVDLDRFKDVNDTLGHPVGDRVITTVANRLAALTGPDTPLARLGGDEFAVFLTGATVGPDLDRTVAAIGRAIEAPIAIDDFAVNLGSSSGIAVAPDHGVDPTTLFSRADVAMYAAKRAGQASAYYHVDHDNHSPRRLQLQARLKDAIDADALTLFYQPKVTADRRRVVGLEALCRWNDAEFGFISPGEFIPLAEQSGMIRDLTESVIRIALRDLACWQYLGVAVPVSINLSARNLLDDTLPDRVATQLRKNSIDTSLVTFEVTETAIMLDRQRVIANLRRFRALGIRLSIDDYGTGYASLSYLRDLPVDELKIDRAFVDGIDGDHHNQAIVHSTIDLAHALGLTVVAEGVEQEAEAEVLLRFGCDQWQGYLFGAPKPLDATTELLERDVRYTFPAR